MATRSRKGGFLRKTLKAKSKSKSKTKTVTVRKTRKVDKPKAKIVPVSQILKTRKEGKGPPTVF